MCAGSLSLIRTRGGASSSNCGHIASLTTDIEDPCVPTVLWYRFYMQFIVPAQPRLRTSPPAGDNWIHEIKFDGWRIQLHKEGRSVAIYTKNGYRCAHKIELIAGRGVHRPSNAGTYNNSAIDYGALRAAGPTEFRRGRWRRRSDTNHASGDRTALQP